MSTKVLVLGGGRVGGAIARDLAREEDLHVTVADVSARTLAAYAEDRDLSTLELDATDAAELARGLASFDLVVGAVPGHLGFATVETVLAAGKSIVDISFFEEDAFRLDDLAREAGAVAIVDCGIAPGCGNLMLGHLDATLDRVESFTCYVGGLPAVRTWPYEYKVVFSPLDTIEEYTRPARYKVHGEVVTAPALSELELVDLPGVGTLEAFNTDGLRTLLTTVDVPHLQEKTLRYPGHAERMRMLRETGFFSKEPLKVSGATLCPLDITARLLADAWRLDEGEEDLLVMRAEIVGEKGGRRVLHRWDLLDRYDAATGTTAMARCTGYTCAAAARLVARGVYTRPGISPPELVGRQEGAMERIFSELADRGVVFHHSVAEL